MLKAIYTQVNYCFKTFFSLVFKKSGCDTGGSLKELFSLCSKVQTELRGAGPKGHPGTNQIPKEQFDQFFMRSGGEEVNLKTATDFLTGKSGTA